ncbi:heat intolerant 4-like protein [Tanacetum coccineum]
MKLNSQILILSCLQRRDGLKHLKLDRVKKFEYCLPYFYHSFREDETEQNTIVDIMFPAKPHVIYNDDRHVFCRQQDIMEDETEQNTIVDIMFPAEPPVICEFDWELDELEEFTNEFIASEMLTEDQKNEFNEFVKEKVREAKRANREAREKRKKAREEMDQKQWQQVENNEFNKIIYILIATTLYPTSSKSIVIHKLVLWQGTIKVH